MVHEFCLVLREREVSEDKCSALFEAGLDDGTISTSAGISRIDVSREAPSLESAIRTAIGEANVAGLTVARVEIEADQIASQPATP